MEFFKEITIFDYQRMSKVQALEKLLNQSHNIHASVSSSVICKDGLGQTDKENTQIHAIVK